MLMGKEIAGLDAARVAVESTDCYSPGVSSGVKRINVTRATCLTLCQGDAPVESDGPVGMSSVQKHTPAPIET